MRLKHLKMSNFGVYRNENSFHFPYSSDKKVSMIIGKNGSGKTTFLNAIKICLFGPMILRNRTITKTYEAFILDRLNKEALKEEGAHYSIKATFISRIHHYDGEFSINRIWTFSPNFKETIYMQLNGKDLLAEEQTSFFNALYHAFPLDLFELFYLDGEKIDQLSVLNTNIFDLIESSINIDLFKKLKSDLLTYASKYINNKDFHQINEKKVAIENEQTKIELLIDELNHHSISLENEINGLADKIANMKASLSIENVKGRVIEQKEIEQKIIDLKRSIESDFIEFLPYTLIKDQLNILLKKISQEFEQDKNSIINNALRSNSFINYLREKGLQAPLQTLLKEVNEFYPTGNEVFVHNLSRENFYDLKSKITHLLKFNRDGLKAKIKTLNTLENKHSELSKKILEMNSLSDSGELEKLLSLQHQYNTLQISLKTNENHIVEQKKRLEDIDKEEKKIEHELWIQLKKANIANVIEEIHVVLTEYISKIKANKIGDIEHHTQEMFDRLIRKKGFISHFKFENNSIILMDKNSNPLNPSNLSAGEKQIFILSLLYAVLKSSERKVPLMFDTLLGRLDEEHRDNVFKEFIASCPDQVIILATDSELSNIDIDFLNSILNISYLINFDEPENPILEMRYLL